MLSFPDLQTISGANILIGLVVTAAIVVLVADWRLGLYALTAQYLLSAILLGTMIPPVIALVRTVSGALAMAILYLTLRHVADERSRTQIAVRDEARRSSVFIVGFPFRLFALALVAVSIIGISSSMTFLNLPADRFFSSLWLISAGVLVAILSRDVLRLGLGILMFTSGFCILETATEGSLLVYGLLNISDLLLALIIAHLGAMPIEKIERRRARRQGL